MQLLRYEIDKDCYYVSKCQRDILIGSRFCMSCSYCYNHDIGNKTVNCLKKNNYVKN